MPLFRRLNVKAELQQSVEPMVFSSLIYTSVSAYEIICKPVKHTRMEKDTMRYLTSASLDLEAIKRKWI